VFPGKVARISPALDKTTRSAVVEAEVQNPSGKVAPGMYCRVELDLGRREDALLLPAAALLDNARQAAVSTGVTTPAEAKVYIVRSGRAHQQKVALGAKSDGYFEVVDGLEDGAEVVIEGASLLKEGAKVKVLETGGEASHPDGPGPRK
jgi:membrane fusion protein (multidrug efflux system)